MYIGSINQYSGSAFSMFVILLFFSRYIRTYIHTGMGRFGIGWVFWFFFHATCSAHCLRVCILRYSVNLPSITVGSFSNQPASQPASLSYIHMVCAYIYHCRVLVTRVLYNIAFSILKANTCKGIDQLCVVSLLYATTKYNYSSKGVVLSGWELPSSIIVIIIIIMPLLLSPV